MSMAWSEREERFINPYNFVSLGGEVARTEPTYGTLTGKIRVSLITKTPLAIPDAESAVEIADNHRVYDFFRVGDRPVIPGSQLRGMLRSAYETLSNSCLSVNNNNILSARHANFANPGLITFRNGGWHLYKATTSKDWGQTIDPMNEVRRTWYAINGKKTKEKIFSNTNKEISCVNLEQAIENYKENIEIYKKGSNFKRFEGQITYRIRKDGRLYPVFYETVYHEGENYVYLSPSQAGRYVFDNRLDDLLGSHASCSKREDGCLCKACALFGMISVNKSKRSYASRLRFADAQPIEFESMGKVTLKELSGPKMTAVEFYTRRPDSALYWTYDYKISSYKVKKYEAVPKKEKCAVDIRGRKFYLHNPLLKPIDYRTAEKTKRNSTMELCKPESRFYFDIFFERITEEQLRELLWTIAIGENSEDSLQMHKLGHGKPLGLGSVKLVAEEVLIRSFDADTLSYRVEQLSRDKIDAYISENPFDTQDVFFGEYMKITRFDGLADIMKKKKASISYPVANNGGTGKNAAAAHQWFLANRTLGQKGTSTAWNVKSELPEITEDDPTLPEMGKEQNNRPQNKPKNKPRNEPREEEKMFSSIMTRERGSRNQ